jgi:hypothetical protein
VSIALDKRTPRLASRCRAVPATGLDHAAVPRRSRSESFKEKDYLARTDTCLLDQLAAWNVSAGEQARILHRPFLGNLTLAVYLVK